MESKVSKMDKEFNLTTKLIANLLNEVIKNCILNNAKIAVQPKRM